MNSQKQAYQKISTSKIEDVPKFENVNTCFLIAYPDLEQYCMDGFHIFMYCEPYVKNNLTCGIVFTSNKSKRLNILNILDIAEILNKHDLSIIPNIMQINCINDSLVVDMAITKKENLYLWGFRKETR